MSSIETTTKTTIATNHAAAPAAAEHARRFGGAARLWGDAALARLQGSHAVVIGIGGVGSWAAECLARSGVGRLTLIDLDVVAHSNVNRQIHAQDAHFGADKVLVMAQRIASYAPHCAVDTVNDWITPENVAALVPQGAAVVLDCVDQVAAKTALALLCKARGQALIVSGAAGGKSDLSKLAVADLAHVTHDPLLASLRTRLRKQHGYPAAPSKPSAKTKVKAMGVACVFVGQAVSRPTLAAACEVNLPAAPQGLSCAGYGSVMHMTASMGLWAAGWAIERLIAFKPEDLRLKPEI
jgi:tRNA threonylcarbamoyladenosine dehydratase